MLTKSCHTSQGTGSVGLHARDTHVHTHAHQAVPVTFFLGDSAQLESHTSESPESKQQQERRESEEKREPLGRQEVHTGPSGCRR